MCPYQFQTHRPKRFVLPYSMAVLLERDAWAGSRKRSHFSEFLERGVAAADGIDWVFAGLVFEDVPIGFAGTFAKRENFPPVDFVLADDGFGTATVSLDMDRAHAARIFLEDEHWILTAIHAITGVE